MSKPVQKLFNSAALNGINFAKQSLRVIKSSGEELVKKLRATDSESLSSISFVQIIGTPISAEEAEEIFSILPTNKIKTIFLKRNKLNEDVTEAICTKIGKDAESLTSLYLSENDLTQKAGIKAFESVIGKRQLGILDLSYNPELLAQNGSDLNPFLQRLIEANKQNHTPQFIQLHNLPQFLPRPETIAKIEHSFKENDSCEGVRFQMLAYDYSKGTVVNEEVAAINNNPTRIGDAARDYAISLVTPRILRALSNVSVPPRSGHLQKICSQSENLTKEVLFDGMTAQERISFADHWHKPFQQIQSQKLKDYGDQSWPCFIPQKNISIPEEICQRSDISCMVMTNPTELGINSSRLNHCGKIYTEKCVRGESHLLAIIDNKGDHFSTAELIIDRTEGIKIKQHRGMNDGNPPEFCKKSVEWLCSQINAGKIPINIHAVEEQKKKFSDLQTSNQSIQNIFGFDPFDSDHYKKTLRVFRRKMLPSGEFEILKLRENFEKLCGDLSVTIDAHKIDLISVKSEKTAQENLYEKIENSIQTNCRRIGGNPEELIATVISERKIQIESEQQEALDRISKIMPENSRREDEALIIEEDLREIRMKFNEAAKELKRAKKSDKKQFRSRDDQDLPNSETKLTSNQKISKDDLGLKR